MEVFGDTKTEEALDPVFQVKPAAAIPGPLILATRFTVFPWQMDTLAGEMDGKPCGGTKTIAVARLPVCVIV